MKIDENCMEKYLNSKLITKLKCKHITTPKAIAIKDTNIILICCLKLIHQKQLKPTKDVSIQNIASKVKEEF